MAATKPKPVVDDQLLYGVRKAAVVLDVCPSFVWCCIRRGEIKTRRLGSRVLIHRAELVRFASRDHEGIKREEEKKP